MSLAGLSMPSFWLGMVIILALVAWFGWIPPLTYVRPTQDLRLHLVQFALPALAVGYRSSALIMRITRSALLEVLREDYIRTARAKGQRAGAVIWRHALQNAILPVITVVGIEVAFVVGGLVVTETVFNLPGVARFLVQAVLWRDYPVVQNLVMFIAVVVVLTNLAVDLLYVALWRVSGGRSARSGASWGGSPWGRPVRRSCSSSSSPRSLPASSPARTRSPPTRPTPWRDPAWPTGWEPITWAGTSGPASSTARACPWSSASPRPSWAPAWAASSVSCPVMRAGAPI
jgi:hypothetical protein